MLSLISCCSGVKSKLIWLVLPWLLFSIRAPEKLTAFVGSLNNQGCVSIYFFNEPVRWSGNNNNRRHRSVEGMDWRGDGASANHLLVYRTHEAILANTPQLGFKILGLGQGFGGKPFAFRGFQIGFEVCRSKMRQQHLADCRAVQLSALSDIDGVANRIGAFHLVQVDSHVFVGGQSAEHGGLAGLLHEIDEKGPYQRGKFALAGYADG